MIAIDSIVSAVADETEDAQALVGLNVAGDLFVELDVWRRSVRGSGQGRRRGNWGAPLKTYLNWQCVEGHEGRV